MKKRLLLLGIAAAVTVIVTLIATTAFASVDRSTVGVNWHPQQASQGNEGPVEGATASLVRNKNGVSYRVNTTLLLPGNAYTLWIVVVNNPGECGSQPCTGPDIIGNPATDAQVLYGTGFVAGGAGQGTFAGSLKEGPLDGWLANRSFDDAATAEIHLVVNDHGPKLSEFMPGMINTYRGGCSDSSPFPGIFPQTALDDGDAGPNTCLLYQSAIFTAP